MENKKSELDSQIKNFNEQKKIVKFAIENFNKKI